MHTIAVIDYGMGNLRSVAKALEFVAGPADRVALTADPEVVVQADRVVFPGQGAAGDCMRALQRNGLDEALLESADRKPFLGLCMGMQVLLDYSEESGGVDCLGLVSGRVRHLGRALDETGATGHKIPHIGWNQVHQEVAHPLWRGIEQDTRFYFVHSYFVQVQDASWCAASTEYGLEFTSGFARDNLFALQCHPEKSAQGGLTLLANFVRWDGTT